MHIHIYIHPELDPFLRDGAAHIYRRDVVCLNLFPAVRLVHPGLDPFLRDGAARIYSRDAVCLFPVSTARR